MRRVLLRLDAVGERLCWSPGVVGFIAAVALVNAALYHWPLYSFAIANLDLASFSGGLTLATLFFLVAYATAQLLALLALVSVRLLVPVCMAAAIGSSVALYFVQTYGVILDRAMMGNVLNTSAAETGELLHPRQILYLALLGLLPCCLLSRFRVRDTKLLKRAGFAVAVLVVGVAWAYANATTWLWIDKHAKHLGGMTMPWSYLINTPRALAVRAQPREQALLPPAIFLADEKTVVILVIGEAARAQNFSLYGYPRETNPLLAQTDVVVLPGARTCATYTTAALKCMLMPFASGPLSTSYEALPSYLQRHGIDVIWRTRNWGEPPLTVESYQRGSELRRDCEGQGCDHDEVLLSGLGHRIRSSSRSKVLVVLHQHGSHGPSYHARYPPAFERFKPVCRSVELSHCSNAALVNAYDNTIVYTDHFLNTTIGVLKSLGDSATLLMYISDHGESLGEYGLYLHGTPYSIAPDVQKDVPFLVWMSETLRQEKEISPAELVPTAVHTDANIFHSIMGAFDMRSEIYDRQLDIFSSKTE